jgi:hypothetical protein
MKRLVMAIVAAAALASQAVNAQDPARLFKAAMNTEMVDGDLKAAIEQYRRVSEAGDRPLAARALLRMADCYEKLGDVEARRILERVVRDYADQREIAAMARTRLGVQAPRPVSRQVAVVGIGGVGYGSVSRDGRYFPHTNWETAISTCVI